MKTQAPTVNIPAPATGPSHRLAVTDPSTILAAVTAIGAGAYTGIGHDIVLKVVAWVVATVINAVVVNSKAALTGKLATVSATLAPIVTPVLGDPTVADAIRSAKDAAETAWKALDVAQHRP